jgi:hypothetical protein
MEGDHQFARWFLAYPSALNMERAGLDNVKMLP